jgi:hypothetical protein
MDQTLVYTVPSRDGSNSIIIELEEIAKAEMRLADVATVNQQTAPELLATFNESWLKLNKTVTILTAEKNGAENDNKVARAEAKMNCTDDFIKQKGHSKASADLREAFVELDETVRKTKSRIDEISFVLDILKGKQQAFYNGWSSVKRLVDSRSLPVGNYGSKPEPMTNNMARYDSVNVNVNKQKETVAVDLDFEPLPGGFCNPRC